MGSSSIRNLGSQLKGKDIKEYDEALEKADSEVNGCRRFFLEKMLKRRKSHKQVILKELVPLTDDKLSTRELVSIVKKEIIPSL